MSLHIQMSDEALLALRRGRLKNRLISIGVCLAFLLIFGGILWYTVLVIKGQPLTNFLTYTAPIEDAPPNDQPVVKELSAKSAASPTVTPSVIVAHNAISDISAPINLDTTGDFSLDNSALTIGVGDGIGQIGEGGTGLGSSTPGGSTLQGTFYDLKLTSSGVPSKLGRKTESITTRSGRRRDKVKLASDGAFGEAAAKFFENWNEGVLSEYYKAPTKLYASSFYLPESAATYAPYAFQCDEVCDDGGWICVYRGKVRAPKSGKFRFVGTGDEFIGVRFNRKVVLEAGYKIPSMYKKENPSKWWLSITNAKAKDAHWAAIRENREPGFEGYELIPTVKEIMTWNKELGGLTAGKVFEVKEGEYYPIEIAISEIPGGGFGFLLFIEDMEHKVQPGQKFDLFRTNFALPDPAELKRMIEEVHCSWHSGWQPAPYNEDSPVWTAK